MKSKLLNIFILKTMVFFIIGCSSSTDQAFFEDNFELTNPENILLETKNDKEFTLLPLPKSVRQNIDPNRNPFKSLSSNSSDISLLLNGYQFTGIGTVGESKVVFLQNGNQLKEFKVGQELVNGYKLTDINISPDQVKISNGIKKYLIKFNKK
tara:strand:- start:712 stop:1170 length:459 start_codon:yes stop_codon:yes gene_type:complete